MQNMVSAAKKIYKHLQDEESKDIFGNRVLYSLTEDDRYLWNILKIILVKSGVKKALDFCRDHADEVVFYGAGNDLTVLAALYPDFPFQLICDSSVEKQRKGWGKIPIMSPEELFMRKNQVYVAINTLMYQKEVEETLLKNGLKKDRIINLGNMMQMYYNTQYFDTDIMKPEPGEVFIDGGCYNCGTDRIFQKWCSYDYKKIYAFEPDSKNYKRCLAECEREGIEKLMLYHKGLWNCETALSFRETGSAGARIGNGTVTIPTASIDKLIEDENVTFIKMDVEGAELKALQGAEQTIRKNQPKLAICVYHKPEDIITIPDYILSLNCNYKLYLRHYNMNASETVLYAV